MLSNLQQHINEFASVLTNTSIDNGVSFTKKIRQSAKISPQLAIAIYRNNTQASRVNALLSVYPACVNILGKEIFHSIANAYVATDLTGVSDLNYYGAGFDQHLHSILKAGRLPDEYNYLPDLAQLEYFVHAAYYADDDPVFDFALFEHRIKTGLPVYFRVSQSLALLTFQTPIHEIWTNNHSEPDSSVSNVRAITENQYLLIHREVNKPEVHEIKRSEYQLLESFIRNFSFQDAVDTIDCKDENCDIEKILPKLIVKKWICGVI